MKDQDEDFTQDMMDWNKFPEDSNDWDWEPPEFTATKNRRKLQSTYDEIDGSFKEFENTNVCLEKLNDCIFQKELIKNLIAINFGGTYYILYFILKIVTTIFVRNFRFLTLIGLQMTDDLDNKTLK